MKKPSKELASTLRKLFPSSSSSTKRKSFDPSDDCVFVSQQKKKKAARVKPTLITLMLIKHRCRGVPRGKYKNDLIEKDMCIKVPLLRSMTSDQVRDALLSKVTTHAEYVDYELLQCVGQRLVEAPEQLPCGSDIVDDAAKRKGNVVYVHPIKKAVQLEVCFLHSCIIMHSKNYIPLG